ncbi:MAG: hypothetical protein M1814_000095 [Vezdaea aestivalis]|nr:MAG: hypothetical protein M1814_000095 [Vezdaea aestivalis]
MANQPQLEAIVAGLNDSQRAAVTCPNPTLQVLAPPGSGKTKTLTSRVAYLLAHNGYRPRDVIVATFTKKAAKEMRERIGKMIGGGTEDKLILGTFHSISHRYLVRYGRNIGLRKGFTIADNGDVLDILTRLVQKVLKNPKAKGYDARSQISSAKSKRLDPDQLANSFGPDKSNKSQQHNWGPRTKLTNHELVQVYRDYEALLRASNMLDFDDILLKFVELLEKHPETVENIQAVLVDEFQDTNMVQFDLMLLMANSKKRVTIVGDPDQSIYAFRNADISNLVKMQVHYKGTTIVNLEENYRSCASILLASMEVIEQDKERHSKGMTAVHCPGTQPVMKKYDDADQEARKIIAVIASLKTLTNSLIKFKDIAILIRSAYLGKPFEREFGMAGIPYRMVGGTKFFDRVEIKLVLDYMRAVHDPHNNESILRIINKPPRRIGDATIKFMTENAKEKTSIWFNIADKKESSAAYGKTHKGVQDFIKLIRHFQTKWAEGGLSLSGLMDLIAEKIKLTQYLALKSVTTNQTQLEARIANFGDLKEQADDFMKRVDDPELDELPEVEGMEQEDEATNDILAKYLASTALASDLDGPVSPDDEGAVTVSTIHSAKGLEWPVVFVPGVYDGSLPNSRSDNHDEERRLLYVAMTRAKALLHISYPARGGWQGLDQSISPFIEKLKPKRLVQDNFALKSSDLQDIARTLNRNLPTRSAFESFESASDVARRKRPSLEESAASSKKQKFPKSGFQPTSVFRAQPGAVDPPPSTAVLGTSQQVTRPQYLDLTGPDITTPLLCARIKAQQALPLAVPHSSPLAARQPGLVPSGGAPYIQTSQVSQPLNPFATHISSLHPIDPSLATHRPRTDAHSSRPAPPAKDNALPPLRKGGAHASLFSSSPPRPASPPTIPASAVINLLSDDAPPTESAGTAKPPIVRKPKRQPPKRTGKPANQASKAPADPTADDPTDATPLQEEAAVPPLIRASARIRRPTARNAADEVLAQVAASEAVPLPMKTRRGTRLGVRGGGAEAKSMGAFKAPTKKVKA